MLKKYILNVDQGGNRKNNREMCGQTCVLFSLTQSRQQQESNF
jgi:hypothetical protein